MLAWIMTSKFYDYERSYIPKRMLSSRVIFLLILLAINYCLLSTASSGAQSDLESTLKLVAGVYKNPSRAKIRGLDNTVFVTGCNSGYLNHLHNFECFMNSLGIKFLVISMEKQVHDYITNQTKMISFLMDNGMFGEASGSSAGFRDKHFNLITAKKIESVHDILVRGYNVIFSDLDVAIVKDPVPYLLLDNVDYVHSVNAPCEKKDAFQFKSKLEGNTGFYFVRSTPETIKLWKIVFESAPLYSALDDQAIFWKIIRDKKLTSVSPLGNCSSLTVGQALHAATISVIPNAVATATATTAIKRMGTVSLCSLDECMFSSGMLSRAWVPEFTYDELLANLELRGQSMYTVHANYIKGGNGPKMARLRDNGFWLVTRNRTTGQWNGKCKVYVPKGRVKSR